MGFGLQCNTVYCNLTPFNAIINDAKRNLTLLREPSFAGHVMLITQVYSTLVNNSFVQKLLFRDGVRWAV